MSLPQFDSKIPVDVIDGDWIKRGRFDLGVENREELVAWLEREGITIEEFKLLDVYQANVDRLPWLRTL